MLYNLIGDGYWLERWRTRDRPNTEQADFLRHWLDGLKETPRQLPSTESSREHPHPLDELRGAFLLDAGPTFVAYAVNDSEQVVRILHIGAEPVDGVVFRLQD